MIPKFFIKGLPVNTPKGPGHIYDFTESPGLNMVYIELHKYTSKTPPIALIHPNQITPKTIIIDNFETFAKTLETHDTKKLFLQVDNGQYEYLLPTKEGLLIFKTDQTDLIQF